MIRKIDLGSGDNPMKDCIPYNFDLNKTPYPFEDDSVSFIACRHVMEHLLFPRNIFIEAKRILRSGGVLYLSVPHFSCRNAFQNIEHKSFYSVDSIDSFLEGTYTSFDPIDGFEILYRGLNFSCSNYREGDGVRWWEVILNIIANVNPRIFERLFIFYFGGFEEIEYIIRKL